MKSTITIIIAIGVALFCILFVQGGLRKANLNDDHMVGGEDVFIENHIGRHGGAFSFTGPFVYRKGNHPGFIYQRSSCKPLGILDLIPYFVIVEDPNSLGMLTNVDICHIQFVNVLSAGDIRLSTGDVIHMAYLLRVSGWDDESEFWESIEFFIGDITYEFDLSAGRVFRIRFFDEGDDGSKLIVSQENISPPGYLDLRRLETGHTDEERYDFLFSWWQHAKATLSDN
ncbi:MAG: hypothetical protein KF851_05625 [Pirellulaceae bacterium]|nr:hypothetical protein [Pirellulaceae bacterium]